MITINMFSSADKVAGQGVGSAYLELIKMLKDRFSDEFEININRYTKSQISHYHTIDLPFYFSTFSKKRGRKIGYVHFLPETLEGSLKIPQPFKGIFYRYVIAFYKRMDELVVVNPTFIDQLVAYGIPREKVTYIPNFVDSQEFHPLTVAKKLALRQQLGISPTKFVVLGSGQIQERKGVFDFIRLAKQNPQVQFIWAGGFSFGRITDGYPQLKKVVDNPPANLLFPGIVSRQRINELNNVADLFLLPSYNELFPMSVLEAFSSGTPVMLRDLDLYHAIIQGDYLPAKDVSQMQEKITELVADPTQLTRWQEKARQASQRYSKGHLAERWHEFYTEQAAGVNG
ncbi:glycosyltransferase family 4 protein [uncultured Limosilactobacillus sp.]|uniref:glycosyltransferase family 4 protein n=1 Tax=uncultured Limosilactobacillus sp. TaxID=2837629 RepID=UPI0025FDD5AD|nr:glycosyltransferase family 4 protein [uncultured Limosilactobacillus sp.]